MIENDKQDKIAFNLACFQDIVLSWLQHELIFALFDSSVVTGLSAFQILTLVSCFFCCFIVDEMFPNFGHCYYIMLLFVEPQVLYSILFVCNVLRKKLRHILVQTETHIFLCQVN